MPEYIEREALINRLLKVCMTDDLYGMGIQTGVGHAIDVIKEAPAADVTPPRGAWAVGFIRNALLLVQMFGCIAG